MSPTHKPLAILHGDMKTLPMSREARIEAGDPSVTLDLLVRAVLSGGATKKELAKALATTAS